VFLFSSKRQCPDCQSINVRRSKRQGFAEKCIFPIFLMRPFRCQACAYRYFGLFYAARAGQDESAEQLEGSVARNLQGPAEIYTVPSGRNPSSPEERKIS